MRNLAKWFFLFALGVSIAHADLKSDITAINTGIVHLNVSVTDANITADSMCAPLIALDREARALVANISAVEASITAPIAIDNDLLTRVDTLVVNLTSVSGATLGLSSAIVALQPASNPISIKDGITAMLQLSSDIGEMADRIGEMADKILVMADNIGLMADRIIQTQEIQSTNLAVTQNSVLQTQTNMLSLVSVADTASYGLSLDTLVADGNLLAARMLAVVFSPWTLSSTLSGVETDVNTYLQQVEQFKALIDGDAALKSFYVNTQSLTTLGSLSIVMSSLGTVIESYVTAIEAIKSVTSKTTLKSSMKSMLALSADISKLSNSIGEMGDEILVTADNIGIAADQILAVQTLQSTNMTATQASVLAAQTMAISILAAVN